MVEEYELHRLFDDGCPNVDHRPERLDDYRSCRCCGADCPHGNPSQPCHGDVVIWDPETMEHTCWGHDVWGNYTPKEE